MRNILPRGNPPQEFVPEQVEAAIRNGGFSEGQENPKLIERSARWTYAVFSEIDKGFSEPAQFAIIPAPLMFGWPPFSIAVGALDPFYEGDGFGVIVQAPLGESTILGEVKFPRLRTSLPLALRALSEDLHAAPTLPNASSCCWASDTTQAGRWGFVTCRHAVNGVSIGATLPLQGGGSGRLERKAPPTVDAAFISSAAPSAPSALPVTRWATAGQRIDVVTGSGRIARSVVDVTNTLGVVADHNCPINVYIDQPCNPGDSGALIELPSGSGLGIYRGALVGATVRGAIGQTVGFAQHLEQAVLVLQVTPYR